MISIFNKTITLLNRFPDSEFSDTFYITKINNCCAQVHIASNNNMTNSSDNSKCSLFIKKSSISKPYLKPKDWLASQYKSSNMTFKDDDYVVIGSISESSVTDINAIYDKYDNVFKIYSYAYFNLLDSFQIKAL